MGLKLQNIKNNAHIAAEKNAVAVTWATTAHALTVRVKTLSKLSELSKPVAYIADCGTIVCDTDPFFDDYKSPQPIYPQEYVSALLADNEGMEQSLNIANDATRLWKERAKAAESKLESVQAIANEYQQLMYHMDAGGDFFEFQRDKNNG